MSKLGKLITALALPYAGYLNASEPMVWAMPQAAPATHERSQSPLSPPCRVGVRIAGVGE